MRREVAKGFNRLIIEGDAWNVIEFLQRSGLSAHKAIVKDILNLAKSFVNVNFSFVYKEGNLSTQLLVQWVAFLLWTEMVPISSLSSRIVQGFR